MAKAEDQQLRLLQDDLKRRQYKLRGPKKIANAVNELLAKRGYAQVQAQEELVRAWKEVVGDRFGKSSRVAQLRNGLLEIVVENSIVLQELTFQKNHLLGKLSERLDGVRLKGLRFRVGAVD